MIFKDEIFSRSIQGQAFFQRFSRTFKDCGNPALMSPKTKPFIIFDKLRCSTFFPTFRLFYYVRKESENSSANIYIGTFRLKPFGLNTTVFKVTYQQISIPKPFK